MLSWNGIYLCVIVIQDMKRSYSESVGRVWEIEDKNITSNVREMCVLYLVCVCVCV